MAGRAGKKKRQRGSSTLRGVSVAGGFRAGKRKKGNSLLKRNPVVVTKVGDIRKDSILSAIAQDSEAWAVPRGEKDTGIILLGYKPQQ